MAESAMRQIALPFCIPDVPELGDAEVGQPRHTVWQVRQTIVLCSEVVTLV